MAIKYFIFPLNNYLLISSEYHKMTPPTTQLFTKILEPFLLFFPSPSNPLSVSIISTLKYPEPAHFSPVDLYIPSILVHNNFRGYCNNLLASLIVFALVSKKAKEPDCFSTKLY